MSIYQLRLRYQSKVYDFRDPLDSSSDPVSLKEMHAFSDVRLRLDFWHDAFVVIGEFPSKKYTITIFISILKYTQIMNASSN